MSFQGSTVFCANQELSMRKQASNWVSNEELVWTLVKVQSTKQVGLFSVYTPPPPKFFWKISENIITNRFEYKPESFSFKLILRVTV